MRKTVKMLHTGPSVACLHTDKYLKRREGGEKNSTDGITDVERSTAVRTSAVHLWTDAGPKRCATAGLSAGLQRLLEELDCKKYIREEFLRPRGAVSSNPRLAFRTDSFLVWHTTCFCRRPCTQCKSVEDDGSGLLATVPRRRGFTLVGRLVWTLERASMKLTHVSFHHSMEYSVG